VRGVDLDYVEADVEGALDGGCECGFELSDAFGCVGIRLGVLVVVGDGGGRPDVRWPAADFFDGGGA
jgi:hypothetical protein